jgi:hypothetical protein
MNLESTRKTEPSDNTWSTLIWVAIAISVFLVGVLLLATSTSAQTVGRELPDRVIDSKIRSEIIDSVTRALNDVYVFPDVAAEMEEFVRNNLNAGKYDELTSLTEFAQVLTQDLREICHDRHLGVQFISDEYFESIANDTLTDQRRQRELEESRYDNFGFYKLERLPGNIGYVDLRYFADATEGGETAVAAMKFLNHCDAIIFDLRQNGGGNPSMIQLINSYFFDEPTHLNSFYIRQEDTIQQFWTQAHIEGERMSDVDLYVLTSSTTFSGAEEFAYNLKNLERATLIGETTGGGAHPVDRVGFENLNVGMSLPFGRAINPVTGTNWEGTGVSPDIEVPANEALDVAKRDALNKLLEKTSDEDRRFGLQWYLATLDATLNPVQLDKKTMESYVGMYGPRTITYENGDLYYQREDRPKYRMIPMAKDMFMFDEIDYFRIKVVMDDSGKPAELNGLYDNGMIDVSKRSE